MLAPFLFACPHCKGGVDPKTWCCRNCGECLAGSPGVGDFVGGLEDDERAYHERCYERLEPLSTLTMADVSRPWTEPWQPENAMLRRRLGDLAGSRVLLLGNGGSLKELALLGDAPDVLVISDLSVHGAASIRVAWELLGMPGRALFAAIDATRIPLADGSVDVVYADAMAHHLPDVGPMLAEVARVLAPGGRAVFFDAAFSPLWQWAKTGVLRPMMRAAHRVRSISPEDLRATLSGGFREEQLRDEIERLGCVPYFERQGFLGYLVRRGADLSQRFYVTGRVPRTAKALNGVDALLSRLPAYRNNLIRLAWGFDKVD
jgi:SAM-dependent methyltransferase